MQVLRILSKGKVESLENGFSLPGGECFSLFVRAKGGGSSPQTLLIDCRLICDKISSELPVFVGDWTPAAIVEIAPNAIDLNAYEVFWGAGRMID